MWCVSLVLPVRSDLDDAADVRGPGGPERTSSIEDSQQESRRASRGAAERGFPRKEGPKMTDQPTDNSSGHEAHSVCGSEDVRRHLPVRVSDPILKALLRAIQSGELRPSEAMDYASEFLEYNRPQTADQPSVTRAAALADAALGAEGITVIDPYARQLARWVAEGRMSGDEAVAFITVLTDVDACLVDPDAPSDPGYHMETAPWGIDLQEAVDRGDTAPLDATARASSAMRCDRAFRRAVGASGLDNNLELRDQVLVELIRDLLRGKRSEENALSAGLRHIREAHRSDG